MQVGIIAHRINTREELAHNILPNKKILGVETDMVFGLTNNTPDFFCYHGNTKGSRAKQLSRALKIFLSRSHTALTFSTLITKYRSLEVIGDMKACHSNTPARVLEYFKKVYPRLLTSNGNRHHIITNNPDIRQGLREVSPEIGLVWRSDDMNQIDRDNWQNSVFFSAKTLSVEKLQRCPVNQIQIGVVNKPDELREVFDKINCSGAYFDSVYISTDHPADIAQACLSRNDGFRHLMTR